MAVDVVLHLNVHVLDEGTVAHGLILRNSEDLLQIVELFV